MSPLFSEMVLTLVQVNIHCFLYTLQHSLDEPRKMYNPEWYKQLKEYFSRITNIHTELSKVSPHPTD